MTSPLISITIPFYEDINCIATIKSLKNQTLDNFLCFINDDFSDEKYYQALNSAIDGDQRFQYYRQPKNYGGWKNCATCINIHKYLANTKYSFEIGQHDLISENYLLECVSFLEENPEYIACTGKMLSFVENIEEATTRIGTEYAFFDQTGFEAFVNSVATLADCTVYNAVFRTTILHELNDLPFLDTPMVRFDHLVISLRSALGKHKVLENTKYFRRVFVEDKRENFVNRQSKDVKIVQLTANFLLGYIKLYEKLYHKKIPNNEFLEARGLIFECLLKRFAS
jgi:glycosyltransferase involved in cell wall biosynthesis